MRRRVKHIESGDPNLVKTNRPIVDAIAADLVTHIPDGNTRHHLELLVANSDEKAMNAFVFAMDDESGEDNAVMRVDGSVGDPILSCGGIRRVNNELIGLSIVGRGGLHFDCVVAVAQAR